MQFANFADTKIMVIMWGLVDLHEFVKKNISANAIAYVT